jgi:hypothetical protein
MMYVDIYMDDPSAIEEGHAPDQLYARVPVTDASGKRMTWLCRVNEDQYRYLVAEGIAFDTWKTTKKAKVKIKDKNGNDKEIPHIVFGSNLVSPGSPVVTPTTEVDPSDVIVVPEGPSQGGML